MILRYKARVLADLEAIHDYIAIDNPIAAKSVVTRIQRSIGRLEIIPLSGRPGVVRGTRILAVPGLPYVVIHRVRDEAVEILAILHTSRRRRS